MCIPYKKCLKGLGQVSKITFKYKERAKKLTIKNL